MSLERCSHVGCERETTRAVSKEGKCIFHCEKSDWFTTDASGNQDWSKSEDKVKAFWAAFKQEWADGKSDFSFFVFPEFTSDANFLRNPTQSLSFLGARFLGRADFSLTTFTQKADFGGTDFMRYADFSDASFTQYASFMSASFKQETDFVGASFTEEAYFHESTFAQGVNFSDANFHDSVEFENANFSGSSTFVGTSFEGNAWFKKCVFSGTASFLDLSVVPALTFHSVTVNGHFRIGANLIARMAQLELFQCTFKKDSVVIIDNLIVDILSIKHLVCLSPAIKLGNLEVTKELTINDSMLSGAELNNINLKDAPIIKIAYSSLSKTIFNNVRWGNVERIEADRDTFRQLKAANEDQKNYLQANEFYMMEMKQYREEIKEREWWRQERIDFWFGDFVSRFSNDWVRPIWLFLLLSFAFHVPAFIYLHWCEGNDFRTSLFEYPPLLIDACWFYLSHFPLNDFAHFINPLAREAGERYESVYHWWLLHKILSGLIIYQIIISLRRKTRR